MTIKRFPTLPAVSRIIRKKVFIDEQGFKAEFDDIDKIAVHFVLFDEKNIPLATCRIFKDCEKGVYILGRLAVVKEARGKRLGLNLIKEAENYVRENGGNCIILHAQQRVTDFYKKAGYKEFGNIEYEEWCPHIYMRKYLK